MEMNNPVPSPRPVPRPAEEEPFEKKTWGWKNRLFIWINTILMSLILLAVLVGANVVAKKFYYRWDITRAKTLALDGYTVDMLKHLKKSVRIYLLPMFPYVGDEVGANVHSMLREYEKYSSNVQVVSINFRDQLALEQLQAKAKTAEPNQLVFMCGDKVKIVDIRNIYSVEKEPKRVTSFRGEEEFTRAIEEVTSDKKQKVYFTTGAGEADPRNFQKGGLSEFANALEEQGNCSVQTFPWLTEKDVPEDCRVLVIAYPRRPISQQAMDTVKKYIDRGGSLFVTASGDPDTDFKAQTGLEKLLEPYGIQLGYRDKDGAVKPDCLVDRETPLVLGDQAGIIPFIVQAVKGGYTSNEINRGFEPYVLLLPFATVVQTKELNHQRLLTSTASTWDEHTDLKTVLAEPKFNVGFESKGDHPMAVASEIPLKGSNPKEPSTRKARIVVIGSGFFLTNWVKQQFEMAFPRNYDYGVNCIKWLQGERVSGKVFKPKKIERTPIDLREEKIRNKFDHGIWLYALVLPSIGIILGILAWIIRRK